MARKTIEELADNEFAKELMKIEAIAQESYPAKTPTDNAKNRLIAMLTAFQQYADADKDFPADAPAVLYYQLLATLMDIGSEPEIIIPSGVIIQ